MHNKQCVSIGNPQSSEYNNFLGTQSVNFEFNKLFTLHSGLMLLFIRDLDSVLLYVVKVRGSSRWIRTVCNQSNMENGSSLHIVLPDSALDSFTIMTVHRS